MMAFRTDEEFKPIPIRRDDSFSSRAWFQARLMGDLQLLTCVRFLEPRLANVEGALLDVGCGEMPFRGFLPPRVAYTGIDIAEADAFGMRRDADVRTFDGVHIPFPDDSFDAVLCTEVLEHADDPVALIAEMRRVLKPDGAIMATVPFSARVHHAPHDHFRYTRFRLERMFRDFRDVVIEERGDDIAVVANKLIVICARLLAPRRALIWRIPVLLALAPATACALAIAHLSIRFGFGSKSDPLGYGVVARKS